MNKNSWEEIYDEIGDSMSRVRVKGGWLVRNYTCRVVPTWDKMSQSYLEVEEGNGSIAMCFVPDPNYEWMNINE